MPIRDKNRVEGERGFEQVRFGYEEGRDVWICPERGELRWIEGTRKKGEVEYKCEAFRSCPVVHFCTKEQRRKVLAAIERPVEAAKG